jgi:hypothetical protein
MLRMQPCKHVSHIQVLVTNFVSNPNPKNETGTGSRCETIINSNPLGPIKLSTQSETTRSSQ